MGEQEELKGARKAFKVNEEAYKGLGDAVKSDGKAKRC